MLSPWALGRSRLLKSLVWSSIERSLFEDTSLIHVTSAQEDSDVRRLGIRTPTVVIPNGVDLDREFGTSRVMDARSRGIPEAEGRRIVLFLSRIHPVKGLDLLCQAWATLPRGLPALLLVAGTGDPSAVAHLRRWMAEQPGPPASYIGPVKGERKLALLSSAWLMALPSRSENYGMAVAEALASGTPVLTTTSMPWATVSEAGCGWVVPPEAAPLAHALAEALRLRGPDHEPMRERARELVVRSHSLDGTIACMEDRYRTLVGREIE
jgi:glycosyltransferase involved in cell wall biosynthesis